MVYKVIIAPKAAKELDDAAAWYGDISADIAKQWYDEIVTHIAALQTNPERYPLLSLESEILKKNIRQLLHGKKRGQYRILFEVRKDTVYVVSVRHASRRTDRT